MAIKIARRTFITTLGGAALGRPLAALAQQSGGRRRLGVLVGFAQADPESESWIKALLERLARLGWKSGENLEIDLRWGGMDLDQMQRCAKEIVEARPDVIQVTTTPATAAILRETHILPVVFAVVSDPVGAGFVQNLAHPGGNATGFVNIEGSIGGKWLEILKQIAPGTSRVLVPFNPKTSPQSTYYLKSLEAAAPALTVTVSAAHVSSAGEIEAAVADLAQSPGGGLVIIPDIYTAIQSQSDLIISLAARHRVPAVYFLATSVKAGGLISYGVDNPDLLSRSADYIDRILKGAKPQDLPVQLPTKFVLAVNLKTAKSLGVTVPPNLLATADEVIE
jgi:putative tryptophan/tyrosine transport system substrate-binding protein